MDLVLYKEAMSYTSLVEPPPPPLWWGEGGLIRFDLWRSCAQDSEANTAIGGLKTVLEL